MASRLVVGYRNKSNYSSKPNCSLRPVKFFGHKWRSKELNLMVVTLTGHGNGIKLNGIRATSSLTTYLPIYA